MYQDQVLLIQQLTAKFGLWIAMKTQTPVCRLIRPINKQSPELNLLGFLANTIAMRENINSYILINIYLWHLHYVFIC